MDAKLLTEVQEYDATPSDAAAYGKNAFWDELYANDEEVGRAVQCCHAVDSYCGYSQCRQSGIVQSTAPTDNKTYSVDPWIASK